MARPAPRLLYLNNDIPFFLSHRADLARAASAQGYDVHVAGPPCAESALVVASGWTFHPIRLSRKGVRGWSELGTLASIGRLVRVVDPDLIHNITIKPVLYGGIISRLARTPAVVNAITGLGYVFVAAGGRGAALRFVARRLYGLALAHRNSCTIFQNTDDLRQFVDDGLVRPSQATLIRGSGVDVALFRPAPETDGVPLVVLASRMLWDKGVGDFVEAASALRAEGVSARFALVGDTDPGNPRAIPEATLRHWKDAGTVEHWGHRKDMPAVFAQAHVVCLPSCYREGVPRVLIEAAACARPIVTTDAPGCREIVEHEGTGLLVPVQDVDALARALRRLVEDPGLRQRFGQRGRERVLSDFSLERVIRDTLAVYRRLLPGAPIKGPVPLAADGPA